jgi:hypothetical protein
VRTTSPAGPALHGLALLVLIGGLTGCSSAAAADMKAGDCLKISGPPDRPEAAKVDCGSAESNFKIISAVKDTDECPTDVDSYYSMHSTFTDKSQTVCMDIDWVVGGCMSIDPENDRDPVRAECADSSVPNRQRATQILNDVANVDQCMTGLGYAYDQRQFTVCVEDVK